MINIYLKDGESQKNKAFYIRAYNKKQAEKLWRIENQDNQDEHIKMVFVKRVKETPDEILLRHLADLPFPFTRRYRQVSCFIIKDPNAKQ